MNSTRLTPIRFEYVEKGTGAYWLYKCECGKQKVIRKHSVDSGATKSCGCLNKQVTTHGEGTRGHITKEYYCWLGIKQRCYNPEARGYKNYGGRGITMYEPWITSYETFRDYVLASIGRAPSKQHSLDRINNDGSYEPGNIRWATRKEQGNNRRGGLTLTKEEIKLVLKFRQDKLK